MSTADHDWMEEQQRVDRVTAEIDRRLETVQEQVSGMQADIVEIRKNFWDDVTVNFEDAHEAAETYASIKQQAEVLSERERSHRHAHKHLTTLQKLRQSPYFGRVDFVEGGCSQAEHIYIGIASLLDESESEYLIYDWRAPVSSLYYDYPPGPARYETPGGTISGEMVLKRQYIIRDGVIRSMFDTGVTIGDELLQEVLGKQSDTQMKSIVATIQKEQNRIIRDERSRLLIVQGAAGSGKTSAALQRVAYLLYRFRGMLQADQIVLFSPNPLFNSYVSTVLPELGEENMQQTTFQEYLERRLGKWFAVEDPFTQMEYVYTAMDQPGYAARLEGIRYKASVAFMAAMERYLVELAKAGLIFKAITFRGRTLIPAERIRDAFYALEHTLPIPNRLQLVAKQLLEELKELAKRERRRPWVEEEMELLDRDAFQEAYEELRRRKRLGGNTFDDFALEKQLLSTMVVNEAFKPLRAAVKRFRFVDIPAVYRQLFADPAYHSLVAEDGQLPESWPAICEQTLTRLEQGELAYEDATPYLYLKERIEGFQTNTSVRHVFVDEAQDYTAFQFAFLKRLFPHAKMTVLGDFNQAIHAHAAQEVDFTRLSGLYEGESTETILLTRSYRSTRPIVEMTRHLVPGGEAIEPFNRDGKTPTLHQAKDEQALHEAICQRIAALQQENYKTIAMICKSAAEAEHAYAALSDRLPLRLIKKETVSFEHGVLVIPAYLAKGMEFDAVLIYNASAQQYGRDNERKLFYTACTRAMHELHLFYSGELSPFLAALPAGLYETLES